MINFFKNFFFKYLSKKDALKVANLIKNGKIFHFEGYQGYGESYYFLDDSFHIECYHFDLQSYQKEIIYKKILNFDEFIDFLKAKEKKYFRDFFHK